MTYRIINEELKYLLNNRSLERLEDEFNTIIERWNYLPKSWEWNTKATQLATAICKIVYRYNNDWDKYTSKRSSKVIGTYANWIHNHCFKLKRFDDYEDNLKSMLLFWISMIDYLKDEEPVGSVYEEQWVWFKNK